MRGFIVAVTRLIGAVIVTDLYLFRCEEKRKAIKIVDVYQ